MIAETTWTLTLGSVSAPATSWRQAYERGTVTGIRVFRLGGTWWSTSASRPTLRHNLGTHGERCSCEAGRNGRLCTHRAMVAAMLVKSGQMVECDTCGELLPRNLAVLGHVYIGGVGEIPVHYCTEGHGHLAIETVARSTEVAA